MSRKSLACSVLVGCLIALTGAWLALLHRVTVMLDWDDVEWAFD